MIIYRTEENQRQYVSSFPRSIVFMWIVVILFANCILYPTKGIASRPPAVLTDNLVAVGIFQYLAWYAVLRLIAASDQVLAARRRDSCARYSPTVFEMGSASSIFS